RGNSPRWLASSLRSSDEAQLSRRFERGGARGDTELAIDRLRVRVDRVVREIELTTDVALRQASAEHSQDHQLTIAQCSVRWLSPHAGRSFERREPRVENPGILAGAENRSGLHDQLGSRLGPPQALERSSVADESICKRKRVPTPT